MNSFRRYKLVYGEKSLKNDKNYGKIVNIFVIYHSTWPPYSPDLTSCDFSILETEIGIPWKWFSFDQWLTIHGNNWGQMKSVFPRLWYEIDADNIVTVNPVRYRMLIQRGASYISVLEFKNNYSSVKIVLLFFFNGLCHKFEPIFSLFPPIKAALAI